MNIDVSSLAHTKFNCKYHVVFAPKYRRQIIYGKIKKRYWGNVKKNVYALLQQTARLSVQATSLAGGPDS